MGGDLFTQAPHPLSLHLQPQQEAKDIRGPKGNHVTKRVENKCATGFREKKGVKIFARNGISGEGVKEGRRRKGRARRRKGGTESQRLSSLESRF